MGLAAMCGFQWSVWRSWPANTSLLRRWVFVQKAKLLVESHDLHEMRFIVQRRWFQSFSGTSASQRQALCRETCRRRPVFEFICFFFREGAGSLLSSQTVFELR